MWWVCQQWSDGMGFALACPDQHRENKEAPQHLQPVIHDPICAVAVDGFQVVRQVVDLAWNHRAGCKDPAHAERLAWIPDGQKVFAHEISG